MAAPRRPSKRGPGKRMLDSRAFLLANEVRHLQRCAARHDGGIVTIGQLILFSTQTGDARLLDAEDKLAAQLARDGDPEPVDITETDRASPSIGKAATASKAPLSSTAIASGAG